ncbi:MAG: helix-turn-helix domain-containing protein [Oscillospiraceae bacterium]
MRVKLQKIREGRGYTQQSFSEAIGISRSHYSQIETGEKEPSLRVGLKIKRMLKYEYDDIFFNQKSPVMRH